MGETPFSKENAKLSKIVYQGTKKYYFCFLILNLQQWKTNETLTN